MPGPRAPAPVAEPPRFVPERFAPDVSELDPRNAIRTLIEHDITENPPPAPDRGMPNPDDATGSAGRATSRHW